MMQCLNCGRNVDENSKYCPDCGHEMVSEKMMGNIEQNTDNSTDYKELVFSKKKMFSYITYKSVETNVKISSCDMKISQETERLFKKKRIEEKEISLDTIQSAEVRTVWDFWDTLYAVIFVIFGFFQPAIFLLAALFAYCGYGKEITICLADGTKYSIPCSGKKEEIDAFLLACGDLADKTIDKGDEKAKPSKKFSPKIIAIVAGVVVLVLILLFSGTEDAIDGFKNSTLPAYSDQVTIGEAFDAFFIEPQWSTHESEDTNTVIFSGYFYSDSGDKIKVTMEILVYEDSVRWQEVVLYNVNKGTTTYLTDLEMESLMGAIYEDGTFRWNW